MTKKRSFLTIVFCAMIIAATVCMIFANSIQRGNGTIQISEGRITVEDRYLTYKLYKPKTADKNNRAPAVLLLHGYQNDHETNAAYAIELARRGVVVLSLDEYGHGYSNVGLLNRGYVNQKVSVNYGNESVEDKTIAPIGGTRRYRLMMNFSNLSFFNDKYTRDSDGNVLLDSSCGGDYAYDFLSKLEYVDPTRMGISGHSMGTWAGWTVAADYAGARDASGNDITPKATVLQCGELFRNSVYDNNKYYFNNVLLLQAKYDEFSYFRDYQKVVDDRLLKSDLRSEFLGVPADDTAWNTTFGSFAEGTARRIELLMTNHRLTTHNAHGLAVALEWFDEALDLPVTINYQNQIAMTKEYLILAAMLLILGSMFPLISICLTFRGFRPVRQELPPVENVPDKKAWRKGALITILISGLSFPFMTQLGHALLPLPEGIFRMTIGNGFLGWYLLLIIVMIITGIITRNNNKKKGIQPEKFDIGVFLTSLLLAVVVTGYVYIINFIYQLIFKLDLRFIWPFFKGFTLARLGQFLVYIPFFALFYVLNNTKIMRDLRVRSTYEPGFVGFLKNWGVNFLLMAGGVMFITLLEYIPFFLNIGPGADLLFGSTFGGPFMSILILFVPQVMFYSVLCTYCYRKTGRAYTGALMAAILACWIVTGGSAML